MKRLKLSMIILLVGLILTSCALPAALTAGGGFTSVGAGAPAAPGEGTTNLPTLSAGQLAVAQPADSATPAALQPAAPSALQPAAPSAAQANADPTNSHAAPTPIPAECSVSQGVLYQDVLKVNKIGRPLDYQVYVPPCYPKAGVRYPVLYLFHGQSSDRDQWARMGLADAMDQLIDAGQIPPFIVVMPQEFYYLQDMDGSKFASAVMSDLLPLIDRIFPTCTERSCRAIGGISRGAMWAVMLGLRDWQSFSAIGLFGFPGNPMDVNEVLAKVRQMGPERLPRIYMDSGNTDEYLDDAERYAKLLEAYKVPFEWHSDAGGHAESYWSRHLEAYLLWYAEGWK